MAGRATSFARLAGRILGDGMTWRTTNHNSPEARAKAVRTRRERNGGSYNRRVVDQTPNAVCVFCEKPYRRQRRDSYACSGRCRDRYRQAQRLGIKGLNERSLAEAMQSQNNCCAICRATGSTLATDHDHQSGAFRGFLCGRCNRGIGFLKDDPEILRRAAEYLEERRAKCQ